MGATPAAVRVSAALVVLASAALAPAAAEKRAALAVHVVAAAAVRLAAAVPCAAIQVPLTELHDQSGPVVIVPLYS